MKQSQSWLHLAYWYLVCYGKAQNLPPAWDPEPALSLDQACIQREAQWQGTQSQGTQSQEVRTGGLSGQGFCHLFSLAPEEGVLVAFTYAQEISPKFRQALSLLGEEEGGCTLQLFAEIWQSNQGSPPQLRATLLRSLFFQSFHPELRLKPAVLQGLSGLFPPQPATQIQPEASGFLPPALQDSQWISRLPAQGTRFYFRGSGGLGRKRSFLLLAQEMGLPAFFLEEKGEATEQIFPLVLARGALCLSSLEQFQEIAPYEAHLPLVVLLGEGPCPLPSFLTVEFPPLGYQEAYDCWSGVPWDLPLSPSCRLRSFANQYALSPGEIHQVAQKAQRRGRMLGHRALSAPLIQEEITALLQEKTGTILPPAPPTYTLKDVVLPPAQLEKLQQVISQVLYRHQVLETWGLGARMPYGKGIPLLFAGPPGTGKTMTAGALARELGLSLYPVDIATVVSKYIGETEKNLKKVFQIAKDTQAVLFFDEADVLFSKRSEVQNANDKYSNMEAAFLLQEMERYQGISILATNLVQNLDEAFKRRLKFLITFPAPTPAQREALFQKAIPPGLPLDSQVDFPFLAQQFSLSGGNIRNVVYHAAFLAAEQDSPLGMAHLLSAILVEYEKMGKALSPHDFGIYASLLEEEKP